MKNIILITTILSLILLSGCNSTTPQVCIENNCFNVDIANTPKMRQQGLMFREQLDANSGMLFIFEKPDRQLFWMKNTKMPLDIIWINSEKEIEFIQHNAVPCTKDPCTIYGPKTNSTMYVLEINEGISKQLNIKKGEKVKFENIK